MERQEKKKRQARKLRRDFTDHKRANLYPFQCIYTFVAGEGARVKLDFEQFQLAGTSEK